MIPHSGKFFFLEEHNEDLDDDGFRKFRYEIKSNILNYSPTMA